MQAGATEADLALLGDRARARRAEASQAAGRYRRETWYRFVLVFFPIPFVLVLLRLHIDAWAYAVAGGLFVLSAAALYALDGRAAAAVAQAERRAEEAERALAAVERRPMPADGRAAAPSAPA